MADTTLDTSQTTVSNEKEKLSEANDNYIKVLKSALLEVSNKNESQQSELKLQMEIIQDLQKQIK